MKAKAKKGTTQVERALLICTAKRGVFFGYTAEDCMAIMSRGTATLQRARMCTYWSDKTKGVLGLAGMGPQAGSRIGPQVPELVCESITAVVVCTDVAAATWETAPWT